MAQSRDKNKRMHAVRQPRDHNFAADALDSPIISYGLDDKIPHIENSAHEAYHYGNAKMHGGPISDSIRKEINRMHMLMELDFKLEEADRILSNVPLELKNSLDKVQDADLAKFRSESDKENIALDYDKLVEDLTGNRDRKLTNG